MNKKEKEILHRADRSMAEAKAQIEVMKIKIKSFEEQEYQLKQRIEIDVLIAANKQQTLFAQLRAVEARLHLAYSIMHLQKQDGFMKSENQVYAQGYLDVIKGKVLI